MIDAECFSYVDSDEDLESVQEAMGDLAGSSATKRKRGKQILKSPEKLVSLLRNTLYFVVHVTCLGCGREPVCIVAMIH